MSREESKKKTAEKSRSGGGDATPQFGPVGVADRSVGNALLVGLDLGTNCSVFQASENGKRLDLRDDTVLSVVGFPKAGMLPGILPANTDTLFGEEALDLRLHLDLTWPLRDGVVHDLSVCKLLTMHLRSLLDPSGNRPLWGVVGAPANATPRCQKDLRAVMVGVLDRLVIVPEPFLAAMGLRNDEGFTQSGAPVDPTRHSIIVDIGAGTTDICLVRGYFPTSRDQISFPVAGNAIDEKLHNLIHQRYPDLNLSSVSITQIKEEHSFVGNTIEEAVVKVYADGRPRQLNFGDMVKEACEIVVAPLVDGIKKLLESCDSDAAGSVLQNIILTGGGSQISGLPQRVQDILRADGYDEAVTRRPADYKRLVARGGLKIAENIRQDQWQVPFGS